MSKTITFRFTPNKDDYVQAIRAFQLRQKRTLATLVISGILSLAYLCAVTVVGLGHNPFGLLLIIFFMVYLAFLFFINPLKIGRQVENNERMTCEITWEVNEKEIRITNKYSETRFDWGTFQKVIETKTHYLLTYSNVKVFQILPKRAFDSLEQHEAFKELLKKKLTGYK
jgi:hypothetical protein